MRYKRKLPGILSIAALCSAAWAWQNFNQADTAFDAMRVGQYKRALTLFKAPAEQDVIMAQVHLGNLHYLGLGVEKNLVTAAYWYERAARLNDHSAQYNLALLHYNGADQVRDEVKALAWFLLANENGNERAERYLRAISGSLNPNRVQLARARQEQLQREITKANQ